MQTYMLSFGLVKEVGPDGQDDDGSARRLAAFLSAFELGLAWHGGQDALFLKTDKAIDEVRHHVARSLESHDLLLIIGIPDNAEVRFCGPRWDWEAFEEIFPNASGTDPLYQSPDQSDVR